VTDRIVEQDIGGAIAKIVERMPHYSALWIGCRSTSGRSSGHRQGEARLPRTTSPLIV
jgi:hypothetical protein